MLVEGILDWEENREIGVKEVRGKERVRGEGI